MKKLVTITVAIFLCVSSNAQEFTPSEEDVALNDPNVVDLRQDETNQLFEEIQESTDGSDESVVEETSAFTPAGEYAEAFITEKLKSSTGYDSEKQRIFEVGIVTSTIKNPAISDNFLSIRNSLYTRAVLDAKAKIAESLNGEMSASDMLEIPGTDVYSKLNEKAIESKREAEIAKAKLEEIASKMGVAQQKAETGATFGDRFNAFMDGIIKKIDSNYDKNQIAAENLASYQKYRKMYESASSDYENLQTEAQKLHGAIESQMTSTMSIMAEMPLAGATILQSYESYNEENDEYEVAVVLGWSKKAEQAAHASLLGHPVVTTPNPDRLSHADWIKKQDLSIIAGPRSYTDNKGKRWTFGISAVAMDGVSSAQKNKNRILVNMEAKKTALMALLSDVATKKTAERLVQEKVTGLNESRTEAADSLSAKMSQQFEKADTGGATIVYQKTVTNPISQRKMMVCVAAIDPSLSQDVKKIVAESYAVAESVQKQRTANANTKQQLKQGNIPESARNSVRLQAPPTKRLAPIKSTPNAPNIPKAKSGTFGQESSLDDIDDF